MPGAETCRVGPWPGVEWGPGLVRTQVAVSPPWGWRPGCEGQRRGWAGLSHAFPLEGSREEDDDDYENMTPPYKDLPPKPGKRTSLRPAEEMSSLRDEGWGADSPGGVSWA